MKKPTILIAILIHCSYLIQAQNYDEPTDLSFMADFVSKILPEKKKTICLEVDVYKNIMSSQKSNKEIYSGLGEYVALNKIDSVLLRIDSIGHFFTWEKFSFKTVKLISSYEATKIIKLASIPIVKRTRGSVFKKHKIEIIRAVDTSNVVIKTSAPYFFKDNYCIMYYTVSYTESKGYSSFCIFYKDSSQNWIEEKCILRKVR